MKLIDAKDTLPVGFIPVQETVDTRESPLALFITGRVSFLPDLGYSYVHFSLQPVQEVSLHARD
jgi:hypothetical protein